MTPELPTLPALPPAVPHERFVLSDGIGAGAAFRLIPPVGFPIPAADVARALGMGAGEAEARATSALAGTLGIPTVWLTSSGRAGLALVLALLHAEAPERNEVVLPAYGCFTLPSAVVRAGLRIRVVDLSPDGFELDLAALDPLLGPRTLAILAPHLLGYPLAISGLAVAAERAGAFLIDDAAQALGARRGGAAAGTAGAAGILSFGRGKPLSAMGGGAILVRDPTRAARLSAMMASLPPARDARLGYALRAFLGSAGLAPRLFGLATRLPWIRLGTTEYDPAFAIARLDPVRAALVALGLPRLEAVNAARARHAAAWRQALDGIPGLTLLRVPATGAPIDLRFPVLADNAALRDRALAALRAQGIGASRLYPAPITAIPALARHSPEARASFPHARALADRLLCLPTFPHLDPAAIRAGAATLAALATRAAPSSATNQPEPAP